MKFVFQKIQMVRPKTIYSAALGMTSVWSTALMGFHTVTVLDEEVHKFHMYDHSIEVFLVLDAMMMFIALSGLFVIFVKNNITHKLQKFHTLLSIIVVNQVSIVVVYWHLNQFGLSIVIWQLFLWMGLSPSENLEIETIHIHPFLSALITAFQVVLGATISWSALRYYWEYKAGNELFEHSSPKQCESDQNPIETNIY